ncbi:hypothetical protein ABENE_23215 [Asticcacaulis benevestitus DSM 16100 = ATCC BAA-896]|uniref:Uncharacterized protein n=2 Tax=Asticcacaulis TaxID=76890 RepID=V4N7N6_9CAUL|nr:hypothetical protein ABENE_23215 [Asticcacaulis benevestitus DSM 16100 = ATCC BAA-896]
MRVPVGAVVLGFGWWFLLSEWGWMWGITLGWIPSIMLALLTGWLTKWLWPIWAVVAFFGTISIGSYLVHPDPSSSIPVPPVPSGNKIVHVDIRKWSLMALAVMLPLYALVAYLENFEVLFWEFDGQKIRWKPSVSKKKKTAN